MPITLVRMGKNECTRAPKLKSIKTVRQTYVIYNNQEMNNYVYLNM